MRASVLAVTGFEGLSRDRGFRTDRGKDARQVLSPQDLAAELDVADAARLEDAPL